MADEKVSEWKRFGWELRMNLADRLLGWASKVAPDEHDEGRLLHLMVLDYSRS